MERVIVVLLFCFILGLPACQDEPDCVSRTTNVVKLRFYKLETGEVDTVDFVGLTLEGLDSVLYEGDTIQNVMDIPVDPSQQSLRLAFETEFGPDTVVLTYTTSTRLVSEDCGLETLISNLQSARNDFDSINIVNRDLVEGLDENIRIFN